MSLENDLNYYDLLEVTPISGLDEIRGSYARIRHFYTSDLEVRKSFVDEEIKALVSMLDEAFGVLIDPVQRAAYDRALNRVWPNQEHFGHAGDLDFIESETAEPAEPLKKLEADSLQDYYPIPEKGVDGAYIKRLREDAGMSLDEISAITRIANHHLESIEADAIENLPAAVFVRGFVIQLAKTFGLNEKLVTDSYMARFKKLSKK